MAMPLCLPYSRSVTWLEPNMGMTDKQLQSLAVLTLPLLPPPIEYHQRTRPRLRQASCKFSPLVAQRISY